MHRRRLPIGIQTFAKIRADDHYYVDKTGCIRQLVEEGTHYFLSRPRRFGKSLLLDTLGELFAGNEALFRGLLIHPHWDWTTRFPVIRISFGGGIVQDRAGLEHKIGEQLRINQAALGLDLTPEDVSRAGGIDLTLKFNGAIWLFEFKVVELEPEGRALQQIKEHGYADRYRALGQPIHLIGIEFSRERRAVARRRWLRGRDAMRLEVL